MLVSINAGHGCRQRTQQTRCSERPYTLRLPTDTKSPCLLKETKAVILCGTTLIAGLSPASLCCPSTADTITRVTRSGLHRCPRPSAWLLKGDFPENRTAPSHRPEALWKFCSRYSSLSTHSLLYDYLYYKSLTLICQDAKVKRSCMTLGPEKTWKSSPIGRILNVFRIAGAWNAE